jgi:hypothetical protein
MAAERAEILPLLLHFDVFRKKNIFPLDVIGLLGGTEGGGPREAKGRAVEFPVSWVFLNQPPLLCGAFSRKMSPAEEMLGLSWAPS